MTDSPKTLYCAGCKKRKPTADFYSKNKHSRYWRCQDCRREYNRQWMARSLRVPHAEIWKELRAAFGRRCVRCGYYEHAAPLEFAIIGKRPKGKAQLANVINRYAHSPNDDAWQALLDAVSMRVLLCANCATALRANDWNWNDLLKSRPGLRRGPHWPIARPVPIVPEVSE